MRIFSLIRLMVLIVLGLTLTARDVRSASPRMSADVLLRQTISDLPKGKADIRVHLDTWELSSETGEHRHGGPTIVYVLEGQLTWVERGVPRTLSAGQVFLEPAGVPHNVKNLGARPAKALAVHLDPAR